MCFKSTNVHSKPTRQKLTSWLQIVERAKNVSFLVDIKSIPNAINC